MIDSQAVFSKNTAGSLLNPATESTLQSILSDTSQIVMSVDNALSATAYDLNSAAYSATTNITNDYILDSITLDFSTAESKTITVTNSQGTTLFTETSTSQNIVYKFNQAFNTGENITVSVTQTTGACLMDLRLKIMQGSNTLAGNPVFGAGTNEIGKTRITARNCSTDTTEEIYGCDNSLFSIVYPDIIATGKIPNHESFRGFGERINATNITAGNDVWQGTATAIPIPDQTVGEQMTVVSTSAQDGVAGTGIVTLDIHGIDIGGVARQEVVIMNGVTPVNTVRTNWRFIQSIHAETVGTGGVAVGTITIYRTGDATRIYNQVNPGGNMSLCSARMIPAGKVFYMTNLSVMAADNTSVSVRLRATSTFEDTVTPGYFFLFKDVSVLENSSREKTFKIALKFPALSILKFTAYSTTNGAAISVNFDGWIENI